jgi:Alpha-L-fucosidase
MRFLRAVLAAAASLFTLTPAAGEMTDFRKSKLGFFVHYVWAGGGGGLTIDRNGGRPADFDAFAQAFDVEGFANDMAAWQVEYVIFTAWHANINPLFPSATMAKWGLPGHACKRDLIGEVIGALKAKGIPVVLYTHPRDGHDLRGDERLKTGWGSGGAGADPDWNEFDYPKWNDFTNELYAELVDRYGRDISGLFLDEGSSAGDSHRVVDYPRLRRTIKSRAPHLVLQQNYYGTEYSCDVGVKEYHHWQQFENRDGGAWPAWDIPVAAVFATTWWAAKPANHPATVVYSAEDMFRYTVLQAGANTRGGGMQWAAGPYAGGGWEPGVVETMTRFAGFLKPIAPSIKGTLASKAFPTSKGAALKNIGWGVRAVEWGVATDSPDGSITWLHVLNPPRGAQVRIGMPANGARFARATHLVTGRPVRLDFDKAGYLVTLPEGLGWDPLDTVIRLDAR